MEFLSTYKMRNSRIKVDSNLGYFEVACDCERLVFNGLG